MFKGTINIYIDSLNMNEEFILGIRIDSFYSVYTRSAFNKRNGELSAFTTRHHHFNTCF